MGDSRNAERFMGFAKTYEDTRPHVPVYPTTVIARYLGHVPGMVLDIGCGTGLSTEVWLGRCRQIVGVEPSSDMIAEARRKEAPGMSFVQAYGDDVPLPEGCAEAIVCSQSFHWMEPKATLKEVDRLLKKGGVFATVDYDWPPVMRWEAEQAYARFQKEVRQIERGMPEVRETFVRYDKSRHLANIVESGYFRHAREILFANQEECTPQRLMNLPLSMGGNQTIMKHHPGALDEPYKRYCERIGELYQGTFTLDVCYRMRLGIK